MQKNYDIKTAMQELDLVETEIMQKAEKHLEASNSFEIAKIYSLVKKEQYKIDEDARKLKLTGQLDSEMYGIMSEGYRGIGIRLIRLSREYSLGNRMLEIHDAIKFSNEINSTFLNQYLRDTEDKS